MNEKQKKHQSQSKTKKTVALAELENTILRTGFPLENRIYEILKDAGWSTISNKYYIDDQEQTVREIDLLAYKVTKVKHFSVYTALIFSCKKSEKSVWALLSRDPNFNDPNFNWQPAHIWSNDKPLNYQCSLTGWQQDYHSRLKGLNAGALRTPAMDIFAYQEMDAQNGLALDSKNIYSSITSLMKAQSYELNVRRKRVKRPAIYQFNLVTVLDGRLVRISFDKTQRKAGEITSEHYVARYILEKEETFARIHFITVDEFSSILKEYDELHDANCSVFGQLHDDFFLRIETDQKRLDILLEEFRKELTIDLRILLFNKYGDLVDIGKIGLEWNDHSKHLSILVTCDADKIDHMNEQEEFRDRAAAALKEIYKYTGPFKFSDDVPF